jgi:heavy metal response regulator
MGGAVMRILVVEDEKRLARIIKQGLAEEGYAVDAVHDGKDALHLAESTPFNVIILDIMLPEIDGITVCQTLRLRKINSPILMLTAKDSIEDRVKGLDAGADDYLVKPFAFSELSARIRALLRRETTVKTPTLQVNGLVMNTVTREVRKGNKKIDLTTKEFSILEYFMRNPNAVITRTMIEENIWNYDFDVLSNVIDVYIRRLRIKIDDDGRDSFIQTLRGAGYRLKGI